ncbi:MAG TPA: hypothetical protein VJK52_03990 [Candidatus Nanoarchaeia archaeon]|nr:hypothetical protein [Candidatus Nanoarchaeia archaeon]
MKLLSLISGGIDSPVAAHLMQNLGHEIIYVHFYNHTAAKEIVKDKVQRLVGQVSGPTAKLHIVPFEPIQRMLIGHVPAEYRMIVYRRVMFWIAEEMRKKEHAEGFITGDSIGQVASQTLTNLTTIHRAAADIPIYAPLLGFDKEEIIKIAKEIGTYEISILPYSDCCSFLIARHPATKAPRQKIEEIEQGLDREKLIQLALSIPVQTSLLPE